MPTLGEWAGGEEALKHLFARFYERVQEHTLLRSVFADIHPHHAERVAAFVGEVLGGAKAYSESGGTHAGMIARHVGRHLTEQQRRAQLPQRAQSCPSDIGC